MRTERQDIGRDFLFGLIVAVLLILAKEYIDGKTEVGKQLELATYGWLQHRLTSVEPDAKLPIVIVDLGDLKPKAIPGAQKREEATPRKELQELISDLLMKEGAHAVGVDVDFSPEQEGRLPVTPEDYDFFKFCMEIEKAAQKKVYLGVYRTVLLPREKWLGRKEYKKLGASILAPRFEVTKMVNCVAVDGVKECEQETLAALLASELRKLSEAREEPLVARIPWVFERASDTKISSGVSVGMFPVDYSQLKTLMSREHTFYSTDAKAMAESGGFFRNKIVLLGDANPETAGDKFIVPGQAEPIPGIYIHASAIYTLLQAPLYEPSEEGRWVIDLLLALMVIGTISAIRWAYEGRAGAEIAHHRLEGWLVILVVLLAMIVSLGFVQMHRVLWTDFVLAIFALLLHPMSERGLKKVGSWLWKNTPQFWQRFAFKGSKEGQGE